MKKLFAILLLIGFIAGNATAQEPVETTPAVSEAVAEAVEEAVTEAKAAPPISVDQLLTDVYVSY